MLQQTTVKAVVPYYESFLERFPDVGRVSRPRARRTCSPPGPAWATTIAPATCTAARATCSTTTPAGSRGRSKPRSPSPASASTRRARSSRSPTASPLPVVDGNVRRVLARLFALRGPKWRKDGPYYNRAAGGARPRRARATGTRRSWSWARPSARRASPPARPVPCAGDCRALALGLVERPAGGPRRGARRWTVTVAAALVEREGRVLLVRRAEGRLMGRMWEVPQTSLESRGLPDLVARAARAARPGRGARAAARRARATPSRSAASGSRPTRRACAASRPRTPSASSGRARPSSTSLPVSSLTRKVVRGPGRRRSSRSTSE